MKPWKKFEKEFKDSIPEERWSLRLMDGWMYWWASSRFTPSNLCDLLIKEWERLRCLELKSTKARSITIPRQLKWMAQNFWLWVHTWFIMNFRTESETYFLSVYDAVQISIKKKSISILDCQWLWYRIKEQIVKPNRTKVTYHMQESFHRYLRSIWENI